MTQFIKKKKIVAITGRLVKPSAWCLAQKEGIYNLYDKGGLLAMELLYCLEFS